MRSEGAFGALPRNAQRARGYLRGRSPLESVKSVARARRVGLPRTFSLRSKVLGHLWHLCPSVAGWRAADANTTLMSPQEWPQPVAQTVKRSILPASERATTIEYAIRDVVAPAREL